MQGSRRGVERQGPRSHLEQRLLSSGMAAFVERDNEEEGCSEEEDPRSSATRRLSESLAAAVVMRLSLPGDVAAQLAALPATPSALSLALARDDGSGLVHLPVMEQGSLVWSPDVPGEALPQRSAAWQSFRSGRCLLWRRRLDSPATKYADWAGLLHVHSSAQALLTMPLAVPGYPGALGAATFALGAEPAAADVDALRLLLAGLACAISHHTKLLWEESLGFLNLVIPRRVIQRMLSSSLSLGPLAAAAAAPAGAAAVANGAPAVALEAASEAVAENPGMLCTPACAGADAARRSLNSPGPFGRAAAGTCMRIKTASESDPSKCLQPEACGAEVAPAAAPLLQPASPTASTGMHNGVTTLRQKWNLEFADPVLEEHFKTWFNTLQTKTGLLTVFALAIVMLLNTERWYIAHRSTVVACVRICTAAVLLVHAYLDPGFYSGSLVKALTGSCSLTLVINSFRNRLRFSNHLLVQLAKLYLSAMANAFIYSDPQRASHAYLTLPVTSLLQLAAALVPSLAVYRLEAGMRREFVSAQVAAGMLQLPPAASQPSTALLAEHSSK